MHKSCRIEKKNFLVSSLIPNFFSDAKGKSTLDGDTLRTVLVSYTKPFLYSVFAEYERIAGKSFDHVIKTFSSGDARNALLALCKFITSSWTTLFDLSALAPQSD